MKKLIIANSGKTCQGKSSSIKELFAQLKAKYPSDCNNVSNGYDITGTIEIKGYLVGITSYGDPGPQMPEAMDEFVKKGCQIIVSACRTKSNTHAKIRDIAQGYDYDIIWASNDRTDISPELKNTLNQRYAERVIQLIEDRINGII